MSSGRVHAKSILLYATPASALAGLIISPTVMIWSCLGSLTGLVLHPDLDQKNLDFSENRVMKYSLGLASTWIGIWWVYAEIIPHRHVLSHLPIFGTLIRIIYLGIALGIRAVLIDLLFDDLNATRFLLDCISTLNPWMLLGLCIADSLHFIFDGFPVHFHRYRWWMNSERKH